MIFLTSSDIAVHTHSTQSYQGKLLFSACSGIQKSNTIVKIGQYFDLQLEIH